MRAYKTLFYCLLFLTLSLETKAQESGTNESMTLAQAYINLSLTQTYFDSLNVGRIANILPFEEEELGSIKNKKFIRRNIMLYNFSYSLIHFNKAKLHYRTKKELHQDELVAWKKALGQSKRYYNGSLKKHPFSPSDTSLHELINFNTASKDALSQDIEDLRLEFTPYFNNDIYPEFKSLFFKAKNSNIYNFLGLWSKAGIYDLSLEFLILKETGEKMIKYFNPSGYIIYDLDLKLDLISRYIQLKYIASDQFKKTLTNSQINELFDSYNNFIADLKKEKDSFIRREINAKVCEALKQELQTKFPYQKILFMINEKDPKLTTVKMILKSDTQYFFPNPAPLPSGKLSIPDFKPNLTNLGQVDDYMSSILNTAGYKDQLHYYYDLDGFAMTTSLEKFNMDGSILEGDKRWVKYLGADGKLSFYETFKSLFFETESEFRMFAFIVASKKVSIDTRSLSPKMAEHLMQYSYSKLPNNLKNLAISNKNLTVLVYYFHQNDIGEVPMLEISGTKSATEHIEIAGLEDLLKN